VALIPKRRLSAIVERHPAILAAMDRANAVEQAVLRMWLVNLGQRQAYERMGHFICEIGHRVEAAGLLAADGSFQMPLTQQELGSVLGLTSVHVHRVLQRLRAEALIELRVGVMTILDRERLKSVGGFDPSHLSSAMGETEKSAGGSGAETPGRGAPLADPPLMVRSAAQGPARGARSGRPGS